MLKSQRRPAAGNGEFTNANTNSKSSFNKPSNKNLAGQGGFTNQRNSMMQPKTIESGAEGSNQMIRQGSRP